MPVWQASAARRINNAVAAPEASPSRMLRSSSGFKLQLIEQRAVAGFGGDVAGEGMG